MQYLPERHGQSSLEPNGWHLSSVLPSPAWFESLPNQTFICTDSKDLYISAESPTRKFPHCTKRCHHALSWKTTSGFQHKKNVNNCTSRHVSSLGWQVPAGLNSASRETHLQICKFMLTKVEFAALSALRIAGITWTIPIYPNVGPFPHTNLCRFCGGPSHHENGSLCALQACKMPSICAKSRKKLTQLRTAMNNIIICRVLFLPHSCCTLWNRN